MANGRSLSRGYHPRGVDFDLTPEQELIRDTVRTFAQDQDGFITAFIRVENVKALYAEYIAAGATFDQKLEKQAWGGRDFIVRGPDGNAICFVGQSD